MAAVLVVLAAVGFGRLVTKGKGTIPGRIVGWGALIIAGFILLAVKAPASATDLYHVLITGIPAAASGIGTFIAKVLPS